MSLQTEIPLDSEEQPEAPTVEDPAVETIHVTGKATGPTGTKPKPPDYGFAYMVNVKIELMERYGFMPMFVDNNGNPIYQRGQIPDGLYPVDIVQQSTGKVFKDLVKVVNQDLSFGNFQARIDYDEERRHRLSTLSGFIATAFDRADDDMADGKVHTLEQARACARTAATFCLDEENKERREEFERLYLFRCAGSLKLGPVDLGSQIAGLMTEISKSATRRVALGALRKVYGLTNKLAGRFE